ncbi:MAG: dTDP-4-dehydrorhamnose 3,5-epimerase [Planctomycetota bacterium]|nr:MAG: dTDP-4-dehydrorhamnose 3,5-epimerase [Planctomycetota bacterium]
MSAALNITPLPLRGAYLIDPIVHEDVRGRFIKSFHAEQLSEHGLRFELREEFYSVSSRGVLRGMHFQTPPFEHAKLVSCLQGRALDVLLDLRAGSDTYGRHCSVELHGTGQQIIWIPRGLAHGFLSLEDGTCVAYKTDREHAPAHDAGVRWDSFGFDWPLPVEQLLVSARDQGHPRLAEFRSPF